MSAVRVVDGARASSCWVVHFGDQEKNFRSKALALAWLRQQTKDTRINPIVQRHDKGAYTYYGQGAREHVAKAEIHRVSFATVRARAPKPLFTSLEDSRA